MIGLCQLTESFVSLLWPTPGQTCADYPGITKLLMEVPGLRCSVKFNSFHSNITVSLAKAGPLGPLRNFSTFKIVHPFWILAFLRLWSAWGLYGCTLQKADSNRFETSLLDQVRRLWPTLGLSSLHAQVQLVCWCLGETFLTFSDKSLAKLCNKAEGFATSCEGRWQALFASMYSAQRQDRVRDCAPL